MHDVIIIGGSYAGLSAAMQLGRARRSVLVVDAGERRNRFAHHSHGFLGRDGASASAIAEEGRDQVRRYPSIEWQEGRVTETRATADGFTVWTDAGEQTARRLILATGVVDELPNVPGLKERWGQSVFHCPYCHGYELELGRLGVLASGPLAAHHSMLVAEWGGVGQTTLFVNGAFEPTPEELAELATRKIQVERVSVSAAIGDAPGISLQLADGRVVPLDGLFAMTHTSLAAPFAEQLGCALEEGPIGTYYKTDFMKETSVPGVFACGDAAVPGGAVAIAVADGTMAGIGTHRSLVFR